MQEEFKQSGTCGAAPPGSLEFRECRNLAGCRVPPPPRANMSLSSSPVHESQQGQESEAVCETFHPHSFTADTTTTSKKTRKKP